MAGLGEVCGAVVSSFMVIGLRYGRFNPDDARARDKTYLKVRKFAKRFAEEHGTLICRDLIGCDISTDEGLTKARENKLFDRCPCFLETAVRILEALLN
jgi:C_GCAxxG_C_C family probable redox protein